MLKVKVFGAGDKVWLMDTMFFAPWKKGDVQLLRRTISSVVVTGKLVSKRTMSISMGYHFQEQHPAYPASMVFNSLAAAKTFAKEHHFRIVRRQHHNQHIIPCISSKSK